MVGHRFLTLVHNRFGLDTILDKPMHFHTTKGEIDELAI